jgi:hypothetical protein
MIRRFVPNKCDVGLAPDWSEPRFVLLCILGSSGGWFGGNILSTFTYLYKVAVT